MPALSTAISRGTVHTCTLTCHVSPESCSSTSSRPYPPYAPRPPFLHIRQRQPVHEGKKPYKCPHCEEKIGFFSKALQSWSKIRECPQCKKPFAVTFNIKVFFVALLPMVIFNYFMIKPVLGSLGLSKSIGLGIVCGVLIIISTRLIRVRESIR